MARQGTSSTVNNHSPAHSLSQWNEGTEKSMLRSIQARVSQLKLTHDIKMFTLSIHCTRELVQAFLETPPGPVYAEVSMKNALQAIHVDLNDKMEAWSEWDSLLSIARYDKIREVILDCANRIPVTEMAKSMWRQILTASMNYDRSLCSQIILGLFSSGIVEQVSTLLPNETQDFLNICQALIDAQVPKHRKIERYLKILVQHTGILPQYLFISNTKRQGVNPLMGGGFADVWRGELNQQLVALKVLRIFEQGERRRKILQDFCNEAMIWRQLNHENVLPFYGVSADEFAPRFAMVLPWMSHGNMMAYLKTHPDVNRVPLVSGVAAGLRYLHDLKPQVIHGDLRGVNVLIDEQQRPRIADFGLARVIDSQATTINSSVADGRGNLRWQAPELLQTNHFGKDSGKFTTESDVYSFACVILEIFTDEPPFAHLRTDGQVLLTVVMSDERPPHPGSLAYNRGLTDDIWQLMQDCWKTERLDRPSMSAVMKMVHPDSKVTGTSEQTTVGPAHPAPNFMLKMLHVFDLIGTQTQAGDIEVISPVAESLLTPNKTATARTEPDSVPPANVEPSVSLAIPAPDPPPLPKNASPHLTSPISPTHRRGLINPYSRTVSEARELMVQRRDESIGSRVAAFSFEIGTIPEHLLNRRSRGVLGPTSDPRGYSVSQSGGPRLIGEDGNETRARREQRRSKSMSSDSSESRIPAATAYRRARNSHDTPSNVDTSGWFGKMIARIGLS